MLLRLIAWCFDSVWLISFAEIWPVIISGYCFSPSWLGSWCDHCSYFARSHLSHGVIQSLDSCVCACQHGDFCEGGTTRRAIASGLVPWLKVNWCNGMMTRATLLGTTLHRAAPCCTSLFCYAYNNIGCVSDASLTGFGFVLVYMETSLSSGHWLTAMLTCRLVATVLDVSKCNVVLPAWQTES